MVGSTTLWTQFHKYNTITCKLILYYATITEQHITGNTMDTVSADISHITTVTTLGNLIKSVSITLQYITI